MKHNWERDENGNINKWAWEAGFHNGVFCVDCGKSVCVHCNPDYMELDDCTGPQKSKVITNADRIRAMSDEELLDFMKKSVANAYMCKIMRTEPMFLTLEWLQQPAEEAANEVSEP